jgi:hypothetical protein
MVLTNKGSGRTTYLHTLNDLPHDLGTLECQLPGFFCCLAVVVMSGSSPESKTQITNIHYWPGAVIRTIEIHA